MNTMNIVYEGEGAMYLDRGVTSLYCHDESGKRYREWYITCRFALLNTPINDWDDYIVVRTNGERVNCYLASGKYLIERRAQRTMIEPKEDV